MSNPSAAKKKRVVWTADEKAIRQIWLMLAATVFAKSQKRFMQLVKEAHDIARKRYERAYYKKCPHKKRKRAEASR
jgi:hypothetical protein